MKKAIIIIIFSMPIFSFSQIDNSSEYYESMRDKLNVKFELDNDIESFEYNDFLAKYSVKPNTAVRTVFGFNYRFLGFKIGFSPKFLAPEDFDEKGETKVFKLSFDMFIKNWIQTFEYSDVKGYYVEEIDDDNGLPVDENFTVLPGMKTQVIRGKTWYKLNKNLSMKAIINQVEIQRKTHNNSFEV